MWRRALKKQMKTGAWTISDAKLFMGWLLCFAHTCESRSMYSFCAASPLPRCRTSAGGGRQPLKPSSCGDKAELDGRRQEQKLVMAEAS